MGLRIGSIGGSIVRRGRGEASAALRYRHSVTSILGRRSRRLAETLTDEDIERLVACCLQAGCVILHVRPAMYRLIPDPLFLSHDIARMHVFACIERESGDDGAGAARRPAPAPLRRLGRLVHFIL